MEVQKIFLANDEAIDALLGRIVKVRFFSSIVQALSALHASRLVQYCLFVDIVPFFI